MIDGSEAADSSGHRPVATRGRAAASGVLAAAVALGTTELLAGIFEQVPSLIYAVGDAIVDAVPGWLERFAIATLGTADKPVLLAGILAVAAASGALLGVAARGRPLVGAVGIAAFGALGAAAGMAQRDAGMALTVLAAVLGVAAGITTLTALLRAAHRPATPQQTVEQNSGRRRFLGLATGAAVLAGITAVAGRLLTTSAAVTAARLGISLPPVPDPVSIPPGADLEVAGLTPYVVPARDFFRIDTALRVPAIDADNWSLRVTGRVDRPFEVSYAQLLAMPQTEQVVTIACVSNEVGDNLVGNAVWQGVRLRDLLDRAGVQPEGTQVVGRSVDGFTAGFPIEIAMSVADALVAVGMNGEPLPAEHGFPARLVVPGLYGYVSATKWLSEIELAGFDEFDAYWITRGWAKEGVVKTQSRIDVPAGGTVAAGRQPIAGVAWAPTRGISAVQVRIDSGPWMDARLAEAVDVDTWKQWIYEWDADPGEHTISVRAADRTDEFQTAEVAPVFPSGATGLHTVRVRVT